ncbi:MAG: diguanylate cyclase [Thiogranum sp.]|nr:diguanylate cyclase [Thiogranum sp.]
MALKFLDRGLSRLSRLQTVVVAAFGVGVIGVCDYSMGYEVSMSLFYLLPVAVAAWYAGRWSGVAIAILSCVSWYVADLLAGNQYSHPAIPVWNSLVRLGFFLVSGLLLTMLRNALFNERHLARIDDLTGLWGRRAFEEKLEHDLALAQRHNSAVTLAYLDLDDFKAVNDARGHAEGDRVLRTAGWTLNKLTRRVDTAARLGGDEFALILPDTGPEGAREAISSLIRELQQAFAAIEVDISCSIGVVSFPNPALSAASAVAAADALMYEVKRQGKGAVAYSVFGDLPAPAAEPGPAHNQPLTG